jgi:hypothetical protein
MARKCFGNKANVKFDSRVAKWGRLVPKPTTETPQMWNELQTKMHEHIDNKSLLHADPPRKFPIYLTIGGLLSEFIFKGTTKLIELVTTNEDNLNLLDMITKCGQTEMFVNFLTTTLNDGISMIETFLHRHDLVMYHQIILQSADIRATTEYLCSKDIKNDFAETQRLVLCQDFILNWLHEAMPNHPNIKMHYYMTNVGEELGAKYFTYTPKSNVSEKEKSAYTMIKDIIEKVCQPFGPFDD